MTTYNTGRVKIGRLYIPAMPARDCGSVSGPHRRRTNATARIFMWMCFAFAAFVLVAAQ